jgi:predicted homoserine dehydrogenase-like protein
MNYHALYPSDHEIAVALIGTGAFGNSFLAQAQAMSRLHVRAVCDMDVDAARQACLRAGRATEELALCATGAEAESAYADGRVVLAEDADLLIGLPVQAVVEATGSPEAAAVHAHAALMHGKHVINVTKETDSVIGPILSHIAAERGLVYTQADGDQPSMLISLITWAETLGLTVICAGKSSESDLVYDAARGAVGNRRTAVDVAAPGSDELWPLWELADGAARRTVEERAQALGPMAQAAVADLCEMAIVMNATGYGYDAPALHAPAVRLTELAEVWARRADGGILNGTGVIDVVNCLRRSDEVSFAGGVFVVFAVDDAATWRLLRDKGHVVSRDLSRAAVFLPYHFLGVQTGLSVLSAVDKGLATGAQVMQQRVDIGVIATEPLRRGHTLSLTQGHVIPGTRAELMPAQPFAAGHAVPYYLAAGRTLAADVAAGTTLTVELIDPEPASVLWDLRRQQDQELGLSSAVR